MREQFMVDVYETGAVIVRDNFAKGRGVLGMKTH